MGRCSGRDWRSRGESGSLWKAAAHIFIMRQDRIIVGEVRGAEALDMLQAMNTGHPGSLSTGHSNSARDMLNRLETMVLMGARLPLEAVRSQIASALDILVHLGRLGDGSRKVLSIVEVRGISMGEIETEELYRYDRERGLSLIHI